MSIRQGKIIIADSVSSTTDYQDLINKPKINGVELDGNKTTEDLNINVGITSVNGDTGTNGAVTVKAIENANPNDTMLKIWNGTTAEYLALAEKDLNTVYNVTDEVTADTSKISGFNLFDFKWSDHLINNISWTRADNFSWHSATVYVSAYNKLLKEKERASTVLETETIDDITISFYRSENNYKICLPDQLANLTSLYEKTGVAWYYVIDTENKQFKLPRTKWGFTGLRNKAGDYVSESVPNITGELFWGPQTGITSGIDIPQGAFYGKTSKSNFPLTNPGQAYTGGFDASRSSSTYQDGAPVQERATEMYLYFYVGNTVTVESEVNLDTLVTNTERTLLDVADLKKNTLKTNQITNCITEIPQDIKLELKAGALTLKAGSKVYVPNGKNADGSNKFDVVTIESDLYLKQQFDDNDMLLFVYVNPDGIRTLGTGYKGSTYETRPAAVGDYKLNYITGENKIFWDVLNFESTENSFPIAIVDRSAAVGFTSIKQVFNGFGYIGSTVFALPGVKGLIPNGRNADGSLKNTEYTTNNVIIREIIGSEGAKLWCLYGNSSIGLGVYDKTIQTLSDRPSSWNGGYYIYVKDENKRYADQNASSSSLVVCGDLSIDSSTKKIISLTPKTTFRALDYNDKSEIVGWGMPDYTTAVTVSDSTFTATYKGWLIGTTATPGTTESYSTINNFSIGYEYNDYIDIFAPMDIGDVFKTNASKIDLKFLAMKGNQ